MHTRPSVLVASLFFILSILACGPLSSATPTPAPLPTAPAAEAAAPAASPEPVAQQYYTEEFEGDMSDWSYFMVDASKAGSAPILAEGDIDDAKVGVEGGRLAFDLEAKYVYAYATYEAFEYEDVRIDVIAENRGTNDNNVSLICRYSPDEGWYEFNIANSGLYDILYGSIGQGDKVIYRKLADGGSNTIRQGKETNTYTAICEGRRLTLLINDVKTREIEDNDVVLRSGYIGVSVSSFSHPPATVEIESIQIAEP